MDGKIFNSRGVLVAIILGPDIFDLKGKKLYDLRGINIYKLSGDWTPDRCSKHQEAFGGQIHRQAVPGKLGAVC